MPKVSIVLPSYNRELYLREAIESCLIQSFEDFELIIVDDCSSDHSLRVAREYAQQDRRILVLANKANQKLPATLNLGFARASGEYWTWLSDDNRFEHRALEVMAHVLDQSPEIGLVYTDYTTINEEGRKIVTIRQEPPEFLPIRDCIGVCFLYRAEVAQRVGPYNESLFLVEDYEFFLRMGLTTKIKHIPSAHYFYRIHPRALTQTRQEEIRRAKQLLKRRFADQYKISPPLKPIYRLYEYFIEDKTLASYLNLLRIIFKNPVITLSYIFRNLCRLRRK